MEEALNNALAAFEAFRRLGFSADDLFFATDISSVFMVLRTQDKEFTIHCGPRVGSMEEVKAAWERKATAWNSTMSVRERQDIWDASFISWNCVTFLLGLKKKGFVLPKEEARAKEALVSRTVFH